MIFALRLVLSAGFMVVASATVNNFTVTGESCAFFPNSDICEIYFMSFSEKRSCGWGRHKMICRKVSNDPWKLDSDEKVLKIISYNVRELPHLFSRKGERERTCRIATALNRKFNDSDIVVFQELFDKGCLRDRADMERLLRPYGYRWFYQPLDDHVSFPKFVGAGIMIASKWPMSQLSAIVYKASLKSTSDFLSKKGVLHAAVHKGTKVYHIIGTHLQATYSSSAQRVRLEQVKEMKRFKDGLRIPTNEPVLFVGDFNEDFWTKRELVKGMAMELNAQMANMNGPIRYTYDRQNALTADGDPSGWLDYLFFSLQHLRPKTAKMTAYKLEHPEPFLYCSFSIKLLFYVPPNSKWCLKTKKTKLLSDHYPLYSVLQF